MVLAMNGLEQSFQRLFPSHNIFLTYRATTALYLALKVIAEKTGRYGEVIVPATICPSVPMAIQYAGFTPRFCDVELASTCMSRASVEAELNSETSAVVVVHLFGKTAPVRELAQLCRKKGVFIIEDLAQAIGGYHNDRPLGNDGDYTLISFDEVKIVKGGAGTLLYRDAHDYELLEKYHGELPEARTLDNRQYLMTEFDRWSKACFAQMRAAGLSRPGQDLKERADLFKDLYLLRSEFTANKLAELGEQLATLVRQQQQRYQNYLLLEHELGRLPGFIHYSEDEMCWRLPILLDNHAQQAEAVRRIRAGGALISDHYFPISVLYGDAHCRHAHQIGLQAINLWVDEKFDSSKTAFICAQIKEIVAYRQ